MAKKSTNSKKKKSTKKAAKKTRKKAPVKVSTVPSNELVSPASTPISVSSQDPLSQYMSEVSRYPLLDRDEEKALAVRYYEYGDREAAEKLVTSNLRFVVKVAMEYSKFGAKLIDLIQEGNIGLMQAVKEFNPYKGARLITYAVWWIRGQIQEYLMRHYSMVRIGTTAKQRKLFYQLQKEKAHLERIGLDAGIKQLSGRLGIPEEDVKDMSQRVLSRDLSLDAPTTVSDNTRLMDLQEDITQEAPDSAVALKEELQHLDSALDQVRPDLNSREVYILENRILADDPLTLQEVGNRYGITREAARQMEVRLINKIREAFTKN